MIGINTGYIPEAEKFKFFARKALVGIISQKQWGGVEVPARNMI